ncbi:MAG TPA: long-chain fatty acid--CoA ligase [Chloroflexota bacterium]|nr:long-chain fatty acid--CoA ligase [Chloroflexota bacterium]
MYPEEFARSVYAERPWTRHYDPGVPSTLTYPETTLPDLLLERVGEHPERPAVIFYNRVLTYRRLAEASQRFAAALAGLGVRPGDRVALLLPNTPQFVIAYYGALLAGAVVVPTNPLYVAGEVERQLCDAGAKVIVTLSKFLPTVQEVRERTPLEHVVVTNIKEHFPLVLRLVFMVAKERRDGHRVRAPRDGRTHWLPELLRRAPGRPPALERSPDDLALLQYTGGTTGTAKGAMLTHRNLIANLSMARAWQAERPAPPRGYGVVMGVLPLFHTYGMSQVMNIAILNGDAMVLVPRFEPLLVLKAIRRHRPNSFPGVPTLYTALNNYPGVEKFDPRCVDVCISGASALPVEVKRRFEELTGAKLVEGYGLSEASPVTHCNPVLGLNKAGSIGVPFPDTDAAVVDQEGGERLRPLGEVGELVVRGPQVMKGYWNRPEESAAVLRGGWLYTGDVARMDEDGYFWIVDRKKDVIISGGLNVYPREVEEPLYAHPKVREAVAVGVPHERWGEMVKLYVVLKEGETATEREIVDFCHARMAAFKVPKSVEFRSELPKSLVGKVLRRALREEEAARRAGQVKEVV